MSSATNLACNHDHDYRTSGGLKNIKYKTAQVKIGNNIWIDENVVILNGINIGDNCIIGAGSVIKVDYHGDTITLKSTIIRNSCVIAAGSVINEI